MIFDCIIYKCKLRGNSQHCLHLTVPCYYIVLVRDNFIILFMFLYVFDYFLTLRKLSIFIYSLVFTRTTHVLFLQCFFLFLYCINDVRTREGYLSKWNRSEKYFRNDVGRIVGHLLLRQRFLFSSDLRSSVVRLDN